jgi:hypothetical protein
MKQIYFDRAKFKALIHYICDRCPDPTLLGAVKLNKILWFSEVLMYLNFGNPITGERYVKRPRGPMASHAYEVLKELEQEGKIRIRNVPFHGFTKTEYISLEDADTSVFSEKERLIVDDLMDTICNHHTAKSISEVTHNQVWDAAEIGEQIPYHTVFVMRSGELDEEDIAWAKQVAERVAREAA